MKLLSILLLAVICSICGCNNDDPDLSCNGRFKSNNLAGIQNCVRGSWKIHYSKTAANKNTKTLLANSFFKLTDDDSIFLYLEGDLKATTQANWVLNGDSYVLNFKFWHGQTTGWKIANWAMEKFVGDTLFISTNNSEKITYALTHSAFMPELNCADLLKYKALDQTRQCIWGYWQLHYWQGGIMGDTKQTSTNSFIEIKPNDSIYFVDQGDLTVQDGIDWIWGPDEITHDSVFTMTFYDWREYAYSWVPYRFKEDTLIFYDNGNDGFNYFLTRKSK